MPSVGFRVDVQGIRGIAVLLVVAYHTGVALPGGFMGVDVFFVVSGYVITRMLAADLSTGGRLDFARFYLRRIRRLLPALAVTIGVVLAASTMLAPLGGQALAARTGAAAAVFNANTYLMRQGGDGYFDVGAELNPLLHTWSLAVEEQFYLVFPALLFLAWKVGRRSTGIGPIRSATLALAAISAVSFAGSLALSRGVIDWSGLGPGIAFYSAPTRAWEFAAGGLLALGAAITARLSGRATAAFAALGVAMIGWSAVAFDAGTTWPGMAALVPVVGTAMLLASGEPSGSSRVNRLLEARPLRYLGDISYSWYLWHWPVIVFAAALWPQASGSVKVAAAVASLLPASLSYQWVENPIRKKPHPARRTTLALAAACIAVPIMAAAVLEVGSREPRDKWLAPFEHHADVLRGCSSTTPLGARDPSQCRWPAQGSDGAGRLAVLIGDSNAGHFTEGFVAAMNGAGMDAIVATMPECPMVDLTIIIDGGLHPACREFVTASTADLIAMQPDLVVLAASSDGYIESEAVALSAPSFPATSDGAGKAILWESGLSRVLSRFEEAGIATAIAHPTPKQGSWDPRECSVAAWRWHGCDVSISRQAAEERRVRAVQAEQDAVAGTSTVALDPFDRLCPEAECKGVTTVDGERRWLWRDNSHLTVMASESLTDMFAGLVTDP